MNTNKTPKLSTWLLWSPLKFAGISFLGLFITTFLYTWITGGILKLQAPSTTLLAVLLTLVISTCIYFMFKRIPKFKMDQRSFISIINAQTIIAAVAFSISAYFIFKNAQQIMLYLVIMEAQKSIAMILIGMLAAIVCLYMIGMLLCGVYAKYLRARELGIPGWKIILSMPFGLSALWTPGYIFKEDNAKKTSLQIKCKWYNRVQDWILSSKTNTIATFVFITLASILFMGLNSALLTFILALIFGIWALQVGTSNFLKNIGKSYSNTIIATNIVLVALLICFRAMVPPVQQPVQQNVQINISDIEVTQTQQ
ncbi:MAG: hypothetical protein IJY99_03305 [Alphaproteobacteria bacterium]|nr:hypothetical protein [Alphaproteobacteria bacterium]